MSMHLNHPHLLQEQDFALVRLWSPTNAHWQIVLSCFVAHKQHFIKPAATYHHIDMCNPPIEFQPISTGCMALPAANTRINIQNSVIHHPKNYHRWLVNSILNIIPYHEILASITGLPLGIPHCPRYTFDIHNTKWTHLCSWRAISCVCLARRTMIIAFQHLKL